MIVSGPESLFRDDEHSAARKRRLRVLLRGAKATRVTAKRWLREDDYGGTSVLVQLKVDLSAGPKLSAMVYMAYVQDRDLILSTIGESEAEDWAVARPHLARLGWEL